jgi:multiple sugar transport system permease protein
LRTDSSTTFVITAVSVGVELFGFAFAFVMHRSCGPLAGPHRHPPPYGIITVVSAFVWRYAF